MDSDATSPPPVACTLTNAALARQALEWQDLAPLALHSQRIDGGVAASYPLSLADQIEDLTRRESDCCGSWMTIEHERSDAAIHLQITTTNPEGIEVIVALAGLG